MSKTKPLIIPGHLKRVKRIDNDKSYFLLYVTEEKSKEGEKDVKTLDYIKSRLERDVYENIHSILCLDDDRHYDFLFVDIPNRMYLSVKEWKKYRDVWPSIYFKSNETLDIESISNYVGDLLEVDNTVCSGMCMIVGDGILAKEVDSDNVLGHGILKAISKVSKSQIGYLCTGFDAYLVNEPCTSCAMALVHGRIKRVFVMYRKEGGPFSKFKLCYNKNLNHRYPVYFITRDINFPNPTPKMSKQPVSHIKKEDVELIKSSDTSRYTQCEGNEMFFVFDQSYGVPKSFINILLRYKNPFMFTKYLRNIEETFNKNYDTLLTNFQISVDCSITVQGVSIRVGGFSKEIIEITKIVVDYFFNGSDDSRRNIVDELVRDEILSQIYLAPYKKIFQGFRKLLVANYEMPEEVIKANDVSCEEIKKEIRQFKASVDIVGNILFEDAEDIFDSVVSYSEIKERKSVLNEEIPQQRFEFETNDTENNAVGLFYKVCMSTDILGRVEGMFLNQLLGERFFDELRTNEELGYVVSSSIICMPNTKHLNLQEDNVETYLYLLVQSQRSPDFLIDRIKRFARESSDYIQTLDNSEFETFRNSIIDYLKEKPKNLYDYSEFINRHFTDGIKTVDFKDALLDAVKKITQKDIKESKILTREPFIIIAKMKEEEEVKKN